MFVCCIGLHRISYYTYQGGFSKVLVLIYVRSYIMHYDLYTMIGTFLLLYITTEAARRAHILLYALYDPELFSTITNGTERYRVPCGVHNINIQETVGVRHPKIFGFGKQKKSWRTRLPLVPPVHIRSTDARKIREEFCLKRCRHGAKS